jgi:hypothetical protein
MTFVRQLSTFSGQTRAEGFARVLLFDLSEGLASCVLGSEFRIPGLSPCGGKQHG